MTVNSDSRRGPYGLQDGRRRTWLGSDGDARRWNVNVERVYIGHASGAHGAYCLNGGTLSGLLTSVGATGQGAFRQTGGIHEMSTVTLGETSEGEATYELMAGTLKAESIEIGVRGNTSFTQTGGIVQGKCTSGIRPDCPAAFPATNCPATAPSRGRSSK